jgi:hypothetical protein
MGEVFNVNELIECEFVITIKQYGKLKKDEVYRLNDEYTTFYHKFIQPSRSLYKGIWKEISQTQSYKIWLGFAFEYMVIRHIDKLKQTMGINGIYSDLSIHYYNMGAKHGAQIDLLIGRIIQSLIVK